MFGKAFMDELVKPQRLYSHRTLKTVLTRVAHASIMRLSPASMDRVGTEAPGPAWGDALTRFCSPSSSTN